MTRNQYIRIIALPLSKRLEKSLIYFYAHRLAGNQSDAPPPHTTNPSFSPPILIKKATDLGAKQWNKLALSPHKSWKFKIYTMGERFMDKIPFEEWALKSIEPGTVPELLDRPESPSSTGILDKREIIQLLYPGSLFKERELMEVFQTSMAKCQPYHRKWMKLNILLSPLTLPVGIVPLIPNLPFFYMMWRAWSHWRAYNASRYLHQMFQQGHVLPIPCPILDSLYAKGTKMKEKEEKRLLASQEGNDSQSQKTAETRSQDDLDDLILSHEMVTKLQKQLDLPLESAVEIARGIQQAQLRLRHPSSTTSSNSSNDSSLSR